MAYGKISAVLVADQAAQNAAIAADQAAQTQAFVEDQQRQDEEYSPMQARMAALERRIVKLEEKT